jgi:hypothetical protein
MTSPITRHSCLAVIAVLLLGVAGSAHADAVEPPATEPASATEPAPGADPAPATPTPAVEPAPAAYAKNYVTVLVGTTFFARPNGGPASGWQRDVTPGIGYGRLVTPKIALELDIVPAFISGEYSALYLVPGAVWNFSTYVYAAARFLVPVDPEINFGVFPGIGGFYGFSNGIGLSLELNVGSNVGRGKPDLSAFLTFGVVYAF